MAVLSSTRSLSWSWVWLWLCLSFDCLRLFRDRVGRERSSEAIDQKLSNWRSASGTLVQLCCWPCFAPRRASAVGNQKCNRSRGTRRSSTTTRRWWWRRKSESEKNFVFCWHLLLSSSSASLGNLFVRNGNAFICPQLGRRLMKWPPLCLGTLPPFPSLPLCIRASRSLSLSVSFSVHSATVGALIDESAAGSMNTPRLTLESLLAWACAISGNFHGMISFLQAASLSAFHVKHIYLDFNDVCNDGAKYFPHHIITSTQLGSYQLRAYCRIIESNFVGSLRSLGFRISRCICAIALIFICLTLRPAGT